MMRKTFLVLLGAASGAALTLLVTQPHLTAYGASAKAAAADTYRNLNLFGDVFERVRSDYVEEPSEAELIEAAINGMLQALDPHSSFLNAQDFRDMQVQTRGEFGGLGIEVTMEDDLVKVVAPIDDTPAARAGIMAGDTITHLDGEPVTGMSLREAVEKMRGPVNTPITLTVVREGAAEPLEIEIVRAIITIRPVRHRVEEDIGYIRVSQFNEQTARELSSAVKALLEEIPEGKLKGFVLDLRNNPGGLLDQAISVSDAFLDRGEVVSTRGRREDETQRFTAQAGDLAKGKPVIVLICWNCFPIPALSPAAMRGSCTCPTLSGGTGRSYRTTT
jgi:carboxyl-terminal processing protease